MTRPYIQLLKDAAVLQSLSMEALSGEHLHRVSDGCRSFLFYDVDLGLNPSTSAKLASSKSATYDALRAAGIPAIEHRFLLHPSFRYGGSSSWKSILQQILAEWGTIVIKPDRGSQGTMVERTAQLEEAIRLTGRLFEKDWSAALSPFTHSPSEVRVIVLDGESRLAYEKEANGWKHNLIEGGTVRSEIRDDELFSLAAEAAAALGLIFCSVDFFNVNGKWAVLEVNDQTMLNEYINQVPSARQKVVQLYGDAMQKRLLTC